MMVSSDDEFQDKAFATASTARCETCYYFHDCMYQFNFGDALYLNKYCL